MLNKLMSGLFFRTSWKAPSSLRSAGALQMGALLSNGYESASDLELARQARAQDESAFAEIVRRYSPRVFRVASRFFRQRSLVEDAAQEVFLKAFAQLKSFEGRGSLEGWLTRIATNTCLNLIRASKRRPEMTAADLNEEQTDWLYENLSHLAGETHRSSGKQTGSRRFGGPPAGRFVSRRSSGGDDDRWRRSFGQRSCREHRMVGIESESARLSRAQTPA